MSEVFAIESTADSSIFLLTGKADKDNVAVAVSFDGYFDYINSLTFDAEIQAIRRIHKTDFFLVGSVGKLYVIQLINKSVLVEVTAIKDLQIGLIAKIELDSSTAYLLDKDGSSIVTIAFSKSIEKLQS